MGLTDPGPFSSSQAKPSNASSFCTSLLQVVDGTASLALCLQVVSHTPHTSDLLRHKPLEVARLSEEGEGGTDWGEGGTDWADGAKGGTGREGGTESGKVGQNRGRGDRLRGRGDRLGGGGTH